MSTYLEKAIAELTTKRDLIDVAIAAIKKLVKSPAEPTPDEKPRTRTTRTKSKTKYYTSMNEINKCLAKADKPLSIHSLREKLAEDFNAQISEPVLKGLLQNGKGAHYDTDDGAMWYGL